MKGDHNIIVHLNRLLSNELFASNQYFIHAKFFKSLGMKRLDDIEYQECMDELNHASLYVDRILFLEGVPSVERLDTLYVNKNIEDILNADLKLEYISKNNLRDSIQYADSIQDYVSKDIMIKILIDEEKHIDFIETELGIITKIGMRNYVQSQLK